MIKLNNVTVSFGSKTVLHNFSLDIKQGEHIALMGPSGSGKTTILRLIARQLPPTAGTVQVDTNRISYMFQDHRLLPWMTAEENVNLVLGDSKATLHIAQDWLDKVGLADAYNKYPSELSGGMRQRVSLARALAYNGDIFLLDEPLSALDEDTALQMLELIQTHTVGKTVIFVTHRNSHAEHFSPNIIQLKKA